MYKIIATYRNGQPVANYENAHRWQVYSQKDRKFPVDKCGNTVGSFALDTYQGSRNLRGTAIEYLIKLSEKYNRCFCRSSYAIAASIERYNWIDDAYDMTVVFNYKNFLDEIQKDNDAITKWEVSFINNSDKDSAIHAIHKRMAEMHTFITAIDVHFMYEGEAIVTRAIKVSDSVSFNPFFELEIIANDKKTVMRHAKLLNRLAEEIAKEDE